MGSALERLGSKNGWKILLLLLFNTCPKQSHSHFMQPVLNLETPCQARGEDAGVKAVELCTQQQKVVVVGGASVLPTACP